MHIKTLPLTQKSSLPIATSYDGVARIVAQIMGTFKIKITYIAAGCYKLFLSPKNITSERLRRREYMTNVLVAGLTVLFITRFMLTLTATNESSILLNESSLVVSIALLIIVGGFWSWSRRGHVQAAAFGVIALLTLQSLSLIAQWGFEFPYALLMTTVTILACGVLLDTKYAIASTCVVIALTMTISKLQIAGSMSVDTRWILQSFNSKEVISLAGVLGIIALVTWIMNREMNQSIRRLEISEAQLAEQRDLLEVRVEQRTKQFEELQLLRTLELQRFAEFGRLSANLLHEISNPLTAAYLNLAAYKGDDQQTVILARKNLKQLERYMLAARSQLKVQSTNRLFSVNAETQRVKLVLDPLAKKANVQLHFVIQKQIKLFGDPIKYSQILSNLVANAIDSYDSETDKYGTKIVTILAYASSNSVRIEIKDSGIGIPEEVQATIFTPFYSTKQKPTRGLGIGLPMVQRMVCEDFKGTLTVQSSIKQGTTFTVNIPNN